MDKIKLLLDTDIGDDIDDAFALALLMNFENIDLVGITTVYKNTHLRSKIAKYELKEFNKEYIPVVSGIDKPLKSEIIKWPFETIGEDNKIIIRHYKEELMKNIKYNGDNAVDFIIEMINKYPNELTILAIGPLTNLAQVYLKDKETFMKIKEIKMMGGTYKTNYPEWNIKVDPYAASVVLSSGIKVTSVGVDITQKCKLSLDDVKRIDNLNGPMKIVSDMLHIWMNDNPNRNPIMHDPLATMELNYHFCEYSDYRFDVCLETGKFIENENGKCHALMASSVDSTAFINKLLDIYSGEKV